MDLLSAGMGFGGKKFLHPQGEGKALREESEPQCDGIGRGTAGVGKRQDCHRPFSFSCFYFKNVSDIGNVCDLFCQNSR